MERRRNTILMAVVCAISLCGTPSVSGAAGGYPRLGLYGSIMGDGYPYLLPNGSLDTTTIAQVARYDEVILDINPITPYRPDVLAALRARNPNIRLLAYVLIAIYVLPLLTIGVLRLVRRSAPALEAA